MPADGIDCIHALARCNHTGGNTLDFRDRHGNPFLNDDGNSGDDNDDDEDYEPNKNEDTDDDIDNENEFGNENDIHPAGVYETPIAEVYANHENGNEHEDLNENEIEILNNENINVNVNVIEILDDAQVNIDNQPEEIDEVHDQPALNDNVDGVNNAEDNDNIFNNPYGPRTENYNLQARRPRDYSHLHKTL
jgi:hypothetical protein